MTQMGFGLSHETVMCLVFFKIVDGTYVHTENQRD